MHVVAIGVATLATRINIIIGIKGNGVSGKGFTVAIIYIGLSVGVRLLYDLQSCQLLSLGANKKRIKSK